MILAAPLAGPYNPQRNEPDMSEPEDDRGQAGMGPPPRPSSPDLESGGLGDSTLHSLPKAPSSTNPQNGTSKSPENHNQEAKAISHARKGEDDAAGSLAGELLTDRISRSTMQLVQAALVRRWKIPPELEHAVGIVLAKMIVAEGGPPRDKLRAIEVLVSLDKTDMERVRLANDLGLLSVDGEEARVIRTPISGPPESAVPAEGTGDE